MLNATGTLNHELDSPLVRYFIFHVAFGFVQSVSQTLNAVTDWVNLFKYS
jgi:hypothetical protein